MRVSLLVAASALSLCVASQAQSGTTGEWVFAVSGDSRNCGDVVMPAIAAGVQGDHAEFYWHLGDYRAIYAPDEDYKQLHPTATLDVYEQQAWQDFIDHQLSLFDVPVYLALGNHETTPPKSRAEALQFFAKWWDTAPINAERLADDPQNKAPRTYYHWIKLPVDFITLDNGSDDMFDDRQVAWFEAELKRAASKRQIQSIVVGMHRALPDSFSSGHSMNDTPSGTVSGRRVYQSLVNFRNTTHKKVYVLASHSHYLMGNVYNTTCRRPHPETVLPGWIVGTAGAVRYELPANLDGTESAQNDLYGYLLGHVSQDGEVRLEFKPIAKQVTAIPDPVRKLFGDAFVQQCLEKNYSPYQPAGQPTTCPK